MKHIVLYSTHFPTPTEPSRDIFTAQLADALALRYRVSVIRPIPWFPDWPVMRDFPACRPYVGIPSTGTRAEVRIYYPRYAVIPKMPLSFQVAAQVFSVKALVHRIHRSDPISAVNAHWLFPDGVAAARMCERLGIPFMLTALGSDVNVSAEVPSRRAQMAEALQSAGAASAVSRALCEKLINIGAPTSRTHYLPNGVNKSQFFPASPEERAQVCARLGLNSAERYVVFVGRLHPVKGLDVLLEALGILHCDSRLDFKVCIVGGGELFAELNTGIQDRGLASVVRLTGAIAHREVRDWLRIASVFCLPSRMEGMPNVVLEALACGVPVVASRVGAIPDVVQAETGILVPPGDPIALANALRAAMEQHWNSQLIEEKSGLPDWSEIAEMYGDVLEAISGSQ